MSTIRSLFLLLILSACNGTTVNTDEKVIQDSLPVVTDSPRTPQLRKGNIDTTEFIELRSEGENFLFITKAAGKETIFFYDSIREKGLARGDLIEVQWKEDGGANLATRVKKLKDGAVSLFRKKHPQIIKMLSETEINDWEPYADDVYLAVEYYLSQTKNPLLLHTMQTSFSDIIYSTEDQERDGRYYTMIGIAQNAEHKLNMIQWLYYDNESLTLYEYDLANDKLIEVI